MKKCTNPDCLADYFCDDTKSTCPFCHSRLANCRTEDPMPLIPPLDYGISRPEPAKGEPFVQRRLRNIQCVGRVTEIEHQAIFFSRTLKFFNALIRGEPYQLAHQTIEYTIRVEPIGEGIPDEITDFCLYGSYLGRLQVGDEVCIRARDCIHRRVVRSIYNRTTRSEVRPGLQISAGAIRAVVALVVLFFFALIWEVVDLVCSGTLAAFLMAILSAFMPVLIGLFVIWIVISRLFPDKRKRR